MGVRAILVTLMGKDNMYSIRLPYNTEGNYSIKDDCGKILLNLKGNLNEWEIVSDSNAKILNSQYVKLQNGKLTSVQSKFSIINRIILKDYSMYFVSLKNSDQVYILYCSPLYEEEKINFDIINAKEIIVGRGADNDIVYDNPLVSEEHFRIFLEKGKWMIENFDTKIGVFVNKAQIYENIKEIKNGDIIYLLGIKFVLLGNSIHILGPLKKLKFKYKNLVRKKEIKEFSEEPIENNQDQDNYIELYEDKDYFYRSPRILESIKEEKINIDSPPKKEEDKNSFALTIATSLSMGLMSMISLINAIGRIMSGTVKSSQMLITIGLPICMLITALFLPVIRKIYDKKRLKDKERKRQIKYRKYINHKIININEIMEKQISILEKNNISAEECERRIIERDSSLWERKIQDEDFLSIRIGTGQIPLKVDISMPEDSFKMEEDDLDDIYNEVTKKSRMLENAPISVSLLKNNISAIICKDSKKCDKFMKNILMQIIALHDYSDLKIVFFTKKNESEKLEFVKMLPHLWNDAKNMRFFADDYTDMQNVSKYLEDELQKRNEDEEDFISRMSNKDYRMFSTYNLMVTNDYINISNLGIINKLLKQEKNLGFSLLCITDNFSQLPNECKLFIDITEDECEILENEESQNIKNKVILDDADNLDFETVSKVISNIPIKLKTSSEYSLPSKYNFLEMFDVGNIEQLNILDRWTNSDSTSTLKTKIGVDSAGAPIYLDAHEKYHGPHGLIAGTTGSGKSEFIITYILSLAINYHPDDVTFVLVDYKGGGLAGAFKKKNVQLPHVVGTITNIDLVGLQRSLESIQSELRRRQVMFNKAKDIANESTIDIYKYQKYYHEGVLKEPISHLFIICDEFAELKQQQPDFMSELMSVSRIGRSLGVHLILATQKPAGIVNEQIRSNSKFGICLKVQSKADSKDIIKRPDGATLKKAGQFYINVGNDEYFALGQSGYTGVTYNPSDQIVKDIDNSVEFISNTGVVIKSLEQKVEKKVTNVSGDQLTNVVNYICKLADEKNIKENQLWLDPIPEKIFIEDIRRQYNIKSNKNEINPIIGEYDDPLNQKQGEVSLNFSEEGNTILFGSADSGKEMFINTVLYDSTNNHTTQELQYYILDFGTEIFRMYSESPHVGDVVCSGDNEKIMRLFKFINSEVKRRKKILLKYNGDYKLYNRISENIMPMLIIIINDFGTFIQEYPVYETDILSLTKDCIKYGILFFITVNNPNEVRGRLLQNFGKKITLQLVKSDDYYFIFNKARKKRPSNLYGRGLITLNDDNVFEFQTARMCELEDTNEFIKKFIKKQKKINKISAKKIPILPSKIKFKDVKSSFKGLNGIPIGIYSKNIKVCTHDFSSDLINIITSKDLNNCKIFIKYLIKELEILKNVKLQIIDLDNFLELGVQNAREEFQKFVSTMENIAKTKKIKIEEKNLESQENSTGRVGRVSLANLLVPKVQKSNENETNSNIERNDKNLENLKEENTKTETTNEKNEKNIITEEIVDKYLLYIIIGMDKFIAGIGLDKEKFTQNLKIAEIAGNCSFIIIDNAAKMKSHQMDSWYKSYATSGNGIWIGNGFDSQYVFSYENERRLINGRCGMSMGYYIKNENAKLIKLLGIEEKEDDDDE